MTSAVGDGDGALRDCAKLGKRVNESNYTRGALPDPHGQWTTHISPVYPSRLLRIAREDFNAFFFKSRPGLQSELIRNLFVRMHDCSSKVKTGVPITRYG